MVSESFDLFCFLSQNGNRPILVNKGDGIMGDNEFLDKAKKAVKDVGKEAKKLAKDSSEKAKDLKDKVKDEANKAKDKLDKE